MPAKGVSQLSCNYTKPLLFCLVKNDIEQEHRLCLCLRIALDFFAMDVRRRQKYLRCVGKGISELDKMSNVFYASTRC